MPRQHAYPVRVHWKGNLGTGTSGYRAYSRDHDILIDNKVVIHGSSDPTFRGDPSRHNPEEMLVASLSACHMLAYLHVCVVHGVVVTAYSDDAIGTMEETSDGGGHFTDVLLRPHVTVKDASMVDQANALHAEAHALCFIAASVNFPVRHEADCSVA